MYIIIRYKTYSATLETCFFLTLVFIDSLNKEQSQCQLKSCSGSHENDVSTEREGEGAHN